MFRLNSILLLLLFLAQTLGKTVIYFNYLANRSSITQNFCENRKNSSMHCNGQCHLRKVLDRQEGNLPFSQKTSPEREEIAQFISGETFSCTYNSILRREINTPVGFPETETFRPGILRPPSARV
jgi:hypothetical protein